MSGDKQHFIPQFLLRNFAVRKGNKPARVFVYPKDRAAFRTSTSNITAERHFYSQPSNDGQATLDDEITKFENRIAETINTIGKASPDDHLNSNQVAETVAHFCIRQATIRHITSQTFDKISEIADTTFTDERKAWAAFGLHHNHASGVTLESLEKLYDEHKVSIQSKGFYSKEAFVESAFAWTKKNFLQNFSNSKPQTEALLKELKKFAAEVPRNAHLKALRQGLAPTPRIEPLAKMSWVLRAFEENQLILPDCIAVGLFTDGSADPLLFSPQPDFVAMPVRHDLAIVGCKDNEVPNLSHEQLNAAFAKSSSDFFVARSDSQEFKQLHTKIGTGPKSKIDGMFEEVIRDLGW
ncbi:MAG: hypothetical protein CVT81_09950 [Alphaproteobacteria bacterium HGW-Alphaproteobacteria-3]|nr:MAG: hypothetical protein CVT81_09950 [Alphaproteobacteria bacterium HGW-Alphaproteobacteria-3]